MAVAQSRRAIVLVHGAWHTPVVWNSLKPHLSNEQHTVSCVSLPSAGAAEASAEAFERDVAAVRQELTTLVEQGKDVTLVMHSYGAVPGSEACKGLSRTARLASGKQQGGIVACVYVCAYLLPPKTTFLQVISMDPAKIDMTIKAGLSTVKNPDIFYQDMSPETIAAHAKNLAPWDMSVTGGSLSYFPQTEIAITYVVCEQDQVLPLERQEWLIAEAYKAVAGTGFSMHVERMNCSHSPMLEEPVRLAAIIRDAAERAVPTS